MKRLLGVINLLLFGIILSSCNMNDNTSSSTNSGSTIIESNTNTNTSSGSTTVEKEDITIIYTNDIHGYIANTTKDSSNNEIPGLRLDNISGYKKKLLSENKNVLLVDAGDQVQGSVYGAIDKGENMIEIMNKADYDLATPGNHDFDFGMEGFFRFRDNAEFDYISCNFKSLEQNKNVLDSYKIFEFNNTKVAFIGISTPETITSSTPKFFQNQNSEYIYSFIGLENKQDLYNTVQRVIDEVKNQVDYVIALGHLGVGLDAERLGIRSIDVINNTSGLDAFIDGHSHTLVEHDLVKTKDNKDCILTQTGYYLNGFGEMTITKDGISTSIKKDISNVDIEVRTLENNLITSVNNELGKKIATLETPLYVTSATNLNQRLVRARETNLGDFVSDSVYWYINEYKNLDCDIALTNGGGIRANMESGDITYQTAKLVEPYGNQICIIKTKGINIKNALELGLSVFEGWDTEWDSPAENGGFMQVAGLKFEADANVSYSVTLDSNGMFKSVDGNYRVKNIMVYNKKTNSYEALDENKEYTIGGINYILRNGGSGLSMFMNSEVVVDYIVEDYIALSEYMKSFTNSVVNNSNCPLKKYTNYQLDYENPSGAGRITLLNLNK